MGDNWVIYRGAWVVWYIIDDLLQLLFLEVSELDFIKGDFKYLIFWELMVYHWEDFKCFGCHTRLDFIGFVFQNFDISGRWCDVEHVFYLVDEFDGKIAWRGKGKIWLVDIMGFLFGGEEFCSYDEFKKVLVKDYQEDMVWGLMKNFMFYVMGCKFDIDDMVEIEGIMKKNVVKGYLLREMFLAVFQMEVFLEYQVWNI